MIDNQLKLESSNQKFLNLINDNEKSNKRLFYLFAGVVVLGIIVWFSGGFL
jgi:hypothetical protein